MTTITATPGLKIVTISQTEQGPPVQMIEYLQHDRRRTEHQSVVGRRADPGAPMTYEYGSPTATIKRCDLGRVFDVNLDAREYVSMPLPDTSGRGCSHGRACNPPGVSLPDRTRRRS